MIFKSLTLHNFRVFNQTTHIDLTPKKDEFNDKSIILFGGLNGAGKTSILTAIRLALLGRRALGNAVHKKDYATFLSEQINKKALKDNNQNQAKVTLEFTHTHLGQHNAYVIERTWASNGDEVVTLSENGKQDQTLNSEQVQSFLHELVPPGIGDLFFFDGEKIAELAEDDTGTYLKEAVQKLLGLDVINRLGDDLDIYIKQITKDKASASTVRKIAELEEEKKQLLLQANAERELEASIQSELAGINKQIEMIEHKIESRGGAWAKTKSQEKARADDLLKQQTQLNTSLLNKLSSEFPMALALTAMQGLIKELENEQQIKAKRAFTEQLGQNMQGLEAALSQQFADNASDIYKEVNKYFAQLNAGAALEVLELDISDSDFAVIKAQLENANTAKQAIADLAEALDATTSEYENLSLNIQRAPDEEELSTLYTSLRELDTQKSALKTKYTNQLLKAKKLVEQALENAKRLEKLYVSQKTESSITKAVTRVDATNAALTEFANELTELRVKQLEELFAKSYRKLARKEDLKLSAQIDPNTFDVNLVDQDGININRKSMSAGEKQIFAFAILEALGKLSGKVLPVVVDTPLGRLDSKHRNKLIKHYFPEAGEQVILLSTDTEVDQDYFDIMVNKVSHAFEIEFDQATKCSTLSEGYFWASKIKEAV